MPNYPQYTSQQLKGFDDLPTGVLVNVDDGKGGICYAYSNPFLAQSLGYSHEEFSQLLTQNCFAAIYEADMEKTVIARSRVLQGEAVDSISRQKKKDGSFVWILAHIRRIELDGRMGILFLFSGISELIGLQNELSSKNKAVSDILQSVPIGLLVYKEEKGIRTVLSVNRFLLELANSVGSLLDSNHRSWTEAEFAMIMNQDIYAFCDDQDRPIVEHMLKSCEYVPAASCVFRLRGSKPDKPIFILSNCASKQTGKGSTTYYVAYQNVTEHENRRLELIEKQTQLYQMSYYDAMTGVKNRNAYNIYSENCKNFQIHNVGIAFCDINGLKQTNDTLGHQYGDYMITHFADILKDFFDSDLIYRLSGDEFVVICPDTGRDYFQSTMEALISRVREEESIASIGYIWKESVSNLQRRTTQAEQIMYVEKQQYYENSRTINSKHRPRMLNLLLKDLETGHFEMFLQPKTSIDGSKVIGAEALARRYDSEGKLMLPYGFVPQLETEKLITKLDFYMLEQTCRFLQEMHRAGRDDFSVSVNISRVTIVENEFLQTVAQIIGHFDFDRSNLEFELTESTQTLDSFRLEQYLSLIKDLGIKTSLDDMGNDYSSLTMLITNGFDWVKLDRSLIVQLDQEKARILVKHLINICHDMGIKVIAEGVETDDVRQLLMEMNCDAYQGYLKSKPIPVKEFKELFLS